jgi:hypothetical protein
MLIYQNEKGDTKIDAFFSENSIWMSRVSIARLYQVTPQNITMHVKNIYADGELDQSATSKELLLVQNEGGRDIARETLHYNFPMILAIGYRVRSNVGMHFRNWATEILTEYAQKGFAMNDERLKDPKAFGEDYFDELLERIQDIRVSEKRFYQKVQAIYATSADYNPDLENTRLFFKTVQNKMHYSVHGHTAAELIAERADATKPNMGLTSWAGAKVRKGDVDIAKNYLFEPEITALNEIVTMYLDYAKDQAKQHHVMYMADWEEKLNAFLRFYGRNVLPDAGKVAAEVAKALAEEQYEQFDAHRRIAEIGIDELELEAKELKNEHGNAVSSCKHDISNQDVL